MASLLKNEIDDQSIKKLASLIAQQDHGFDLNAFCLSILTEDWQNLALKQRIRKVAEGLGLHLKYDYPEQIAILRLVEHEFSGLFHLVFPDFVECFGRNDFDLSLQALAQFTQNCSSEFAIRVFIEDDAEGVKQYLLEWVHSKNEHHRRLASEGIRPRLPWASRLPEIEQNPDWVLPIVETLKTDSSRYVQKSVANLLNDLSKDKADWVLDTVANWDLSDPNTFWIVKHALRTLLKKAHPRALLLMGYTSPDHVSMTNWQLDSSVVIGHKLFWQFELNAQQPLGVIRVEYAISFLRKTLEPYRKVFKTSELDLSEKSKHYRCQHDFKRITTRNYVAGIHQIEVIVNGRVFNVGEFELIDPDNLSK